MNRLQNRLTLSLFMAMALGCTQDVSEPPAADALANVTAPATLLDALASADGTEFTTFLAAVQAADMEAEFTANGQRTVFVPTDAAFARLRLNADNVADVIGPELLREILAYPVVSGRRMVKTFERAGHICLVSENCMPVTRDADGVRVGGSKVVVQDLSARNGVAHGIDRLLLPEGTILPPVPVEPPFWGTIFINPDIITDDDPTTFESITPAGRQWVWMFDRRVNNWIWIDPHLFDVTFSDGLTTQVQVNPEFDFEAARAVAEKYAREIGRIPTVLRKDMQTMWIHQGVQPFGGGNNNVLIHVGQAELYERDGILHETLMHEAVHTSLDAQHRLSAGWRAAQEADGNFISVYARDYPQGEDLAETFVTWYAVRYAADRIPETLYDAIVATIPHRLAYLDAQGFDMHPTR